MSSLNSFSQLSCFGSHFVVGSVFVLAGAADAVANPSFDDLVFAGSGSNQAGVVIEWSSPEFFNNSNQSAPIETLSFAWGYAFDHAATAQDALLAVASLDRRLYVVTASFSFGEFVQGIGYDLDNDGAFGLSDGTTTFTQDDFRNGFLGGQPFGAGDTLLPTDSGDLYWGGAFGPIWEQWSEAGVAGGFTDQPERGGDPFWDPDSETHGEWALSNFGLSGTPLSDGSWVGFSVAAAGGFDAANPEASEAFSTNKQAPGTGTPIPGPASAAALGVAGFVMARRRRGAGSR